ERLYPIWNYYLKPSYTYFLNVPHMSYPSSRAFFRAELANFISTLEEWTGAKMSEGSLRQAAQIHNENRALLRQTYELRKQKPPLLSSAETLQLLVAGMVSPVEEHNQILRDALQEIRGRRVVAGKGQGLRLLIYGAEMDDVAVLELIEELGAQVVVDDLCTGTRSFWQDTPQTPDPLEGLAQRYLEGIPCPRTYKPQKAQDRFRYLLDLARDYAVDGVILYVTRFCDTHEFDAPEIREYLEKEGLPVLHLEEDYQVSALGPLRTRLQAFLEMIGG
ncbi:MAG: 2-hydroxyacyl-CoA dehydratase family protein, partial [Chloroflexota bacterium]|nr:2-hydroxyacyl-CoA dehydratase family protein [Chloroflexota bacterium]